MKNYSRLLSGLRATVISTAAFLLSGCNIYDDLDDCYAFLRFSYTYNMENKEWFQEQVQQVNVYFFDPARGYVRMLTEEDAALLADPAYRMTVPAPLRGCRAVVWAGKVADSYLITEPLPGEPVEKLLLRLNDGDVSSSMLTPLWHGTASEMTFTEPGAVQTLPLVRNTNRVDVTLQGNILSAPENYTVSLICDNTVYDHANMPVASGDETYRPYTYEAGMYRLRTMRLTEGNKALLSITDTTTGEKLNIGGQREIDLTDWVLRNKPESMTAQEYLDREYEWNVILKVNGNLALSITINGWTTWFHSTDL